MKRRYFAIILLFAFAKSNAQLVIDAGSTRTICINLSTQLGGSPTASGGKSYIYSWTPVNSLDDPSAPNPIATPTVTTTYYLTVNDTGGIPKTDSVKVIVSTDVLFADAGPDVTIQQGKNTTLHASGGIIYWWFPDTTLNYQFISNPDAEPLITTKYEIIVTNEYGCQSYDDVIVTVIPGDTLYFYNTFTPNNDGDNDLWYIGNLWQYPNNQIKIFNRFGMLVFSESPYANDWDGKSFGDNLPAATYYFVFTPGDDQPPKTGSVTIIR